MSLVLRQRAGSLVLGAFLVVLAVHVAGVCLDFAAGIRYPFELDYGEGIVWQQSLLVPGPAMYSAATALPFIVFHYPPLFYLAVRAARWIEPDGLAAGRLVSVLCTVLIAPCVTGLVLCAIRRPGSASRGAEVAIAGASGLMLLTLHGMRNWGMVMRVDMIAILFSMAGLLVAAWSSGRFWGTTLALLLCVAGLFGKQTELPAGVAIFLLTLLRRPRNAIGAAVLAGAAGLGAVGLLQWFTAGGFLQNVVGYNINRFSLGQMFWALWPERPSLPVIVLIVVAFVGVGWTLIPSVGHGGWRGLAADLGRLREADRAQACRALLVLHLGLASPLLFTMMKSGSSYNYLLDWLCVGCALLGVWLIDLARSTAGGRSWFPVVGAVLAGAVAVAPIRAIPERMSEAAILRDRALVRQIAAAEKPVGSENMTLLMRAGKPVIFEPSIVTELASVGRWDEAPLVALIRGGGLAFMLTTDDRIGGSVRRSPAVDAAMRAVFPHTVQVGPELWLHQAEGNGV